MQNASLTALSVLFSLCIAAITSVMCRAWIYSMPKYDDVEKESLSVQDAQVPFDGIVLPVVQHHRVHRHWPAEERAGREQDPQREYGRCDLAIENWLYLQSSIRVLIIAAWLLAFLWSSPQLLVFQTVDVLADSEGSWIQCSDVWTINSWVE